MVKFLKMQKVFVILLLSLSTCLSKPSDPKDAAPLPVAPPKDEITTPNGTAKVGEQTPQVVEQSMKPAANTSQNPSVTNATAPNVNDSATHTVPIPAQTNATKPDGDNKTSDKKDAVPPKTNEKKDESQKPAVVPATNETSPKSDANTQDSKAKVDPTPPKNDVIPKSNGTAPSVPPKADGEKPVLQARAFDGPSFIGGIILTLGLLAIGYMGFKYYKNQTERNYHTL